jgi:hypothetical protein
MLKPFDFETDEDLLAYSWILLNPPPQFSIGRYFLNYAADKETVESARGIMRTMFKGLPGEFAKQDMFEGFTKSFLPLKFIEALPSSQDDEKILKLVQTQIDRGGPL